MCARGLIMMHKEILSLRLAPHPPHPTHPHTSSLQNCTQPVPQHHPQPTPFVLAHMPPLRLGIPRFPAPPSLAPPPYAHTHHMRAHSQATHMRLTSFRPPPPLVHHAGDYAKVAPYRILSIDIECAGRKVWGGGGGGGVCLRFCVFLCVLLRCLLNYLNGPL